MSAHLLSMTLAAALGAGPYDYAGVPGYADANYGAPMINSGAYSGGGYPSTGDQLYPYDQQDPWLHGYFQVMPAYGGYGHFLPYNYKHVLSQSQTAGGWRMSPTMPYSQQFWHRYQAHAALRKMPPASRPPQYGNQPYPPQINRGLPSPLPTPTGAYRQPYVAPPTVPRLPTAPVDPRFQGNPLNLVPR